jgi:hypothetical protein
LATFWQSNLHTTVHPAGRLTEERALLPDPALFRYTFRTAGLGVGLDRAAASDRAAGPTRPEAAVETVGADAPAVPHSATEPASSATVMGKRTVFDNRGCVLVARRELGPNREAFMGATFLGRHVASAK